MGAEAYTAAELKVEAVILCCTFLLAVAVGGFGFTMERRAVADACISLESDDCTSAEVTSSSAYWVRWIHLMEVIPACLALPVLGTISDTLKRFDPCSPAARAPLLAAQSALQMLAPAAFLLEEWLSLPMWVQLPGVALGALGGGVFAILPTLFAMRADATPHVSHRAAAFVRMELVLFAGLAVGLALTGSVLGRGTEPHAMRAQQQYAFLLLVSCSAAAAVVQLLFWRFPPHLHAMHETAHHANGNHVFHGVAAPPSPARCVGLIISQTKELVRHVGELAISLREEGVYAAAVFGIFTASAFNFLSLGPLTGLYLSMVDWDSKTIGNFSAVTAIASSAHLLLSPLLLHFARTVEALLALELRICALGMLLWTISPVLPPISYWGYALFTAASATVFPLIRAISTQLAPPEQVGVALAALALCEQAASGAGRFFFLSLYGAVATSLPTLPYALMLAIAAASSAVAAALVGMRDSIVMHPTQPSVRRGSVTAELV